jgi:predicted ribosomally synthesized peptide with SipW-like signal peptide
MTDDKNKPYEISRRKTLAALGTIGAASAGAGLGTSAWFSDTESFEDNTVTAGSLDLKVDWQQTYNGPIPGKNQVGWHPVNAYPDTDRDGWMSQNGFRFAGTEPKFDARSIVDPCEKCGDDEIIIQQGGETYCVSVIEGGETAKNFYEYDSDNWVSDNTGIQDEDTSHLFFYRGPDGALSLFLIHDHKESDDGGEAELEIQIVGGQDDASNSDLSWWEQDDRDGDRDEYTIDGETFSTYWIWNGGKTDGGILGPLDEEFYLTVTPEMWDGIETWSVFDGDTETEIELDPEVPIQIATSGGLESGEELPEKVFTSNLYPEQEHLIEFDDLKPGDKGEVTFSLHLCDNPGYIWMNGQLVRADENDVTEPEAAAEDEKDDVVELLDKVEVTLWYDTDCDNELGDGEVVIAEGISLRDALGALSQNDGLGIPLDGDLSSGFESGEPTSENRDPFENSTTYCIGFEWEVPAEEVGNEIQTDRAVFDLGFYTEQARHNDGSGIVNETET